MRTYVKAYSAVAIVVGVVLFATPAFAAPVGPSDIAGWGTAAGELVTDNMPAIGLALIGLATATVALAIGSNLLGRAYSVLASLGTKKPVKGGR